MNALNAKTANETFLQCCTARRWALAMTGSRPYSSKTAVLEQAEAVWSRMEEPDFLEAFDGHPKIGDPGSLKKKYSATHSMAGHEQSRVALAPVPIQTELAACNRKYESIFGFIFIVCATGKSAEEMLELIKRRMDNPAAREMAIAAREQSKITAIRIRKIFEDDCPPTGGGQ